MPSDIETGVQGDKNVWLVRAIKELVAAAKDNSLPIFFIFVLLMVGLQFYRADEHAEKEDQNAKENHKLTIDGQLRIADQFEKAIDRLEARREKSEQAQTKVFADALDRVSSTVEKNTMALEKMREAIVSKMDEGM